MGLSHGKLGRAESGTPLHPPRAKERLAIRVRDPMMFHFFFSPVFFFGARELFAPCAIMFPRNGDVICRLLTVSWLSALFYLI